MTPAEAWDLLAVSPVAVLATIDGEGHPHLVPFVFVVDPMGVGLLLHVPEGRSWIDVAEVSLTTAVGIAAFAFALQGWVFKKSTVLESALFWAAGLLLVLAAVVDAIVGWAFGIRLTTDIPGTSIGWNVPLGLALGGLAVFLQRMRAGREA